MPNRIILSVIVLLLLVEAVSANDLFGHITQGNIDQVKVILNQNADFLNEKNADGMTPLNYASYLGKSDVVRELLVLGADASIGDRDNSLPIHCAAISGDTLTIKFLLSDNADIDAMDINGMTPLLFAISYGKTAAANLLLEKNAAVDIAASNTMTALHYAVSLQQLDLVKAILTKGADLNAKTANNQTPFSMALYNADYAIAELLLASGADVEEMTSNGTSLAYYALAYRDADIARQMLDKETNFTQTNSLGMTMLHYAAARGLKDIVELLCDKGVDLEAKCVNGKTALYYAIIWGHRDIADMLIQRNAKVLEEDVSGFVGEYLGQPLPGRVPETFAFNGLLTPFTPHGKIAFSPDGNEVVWCHQAMPVQAMWHMTRRSDGNWSRPSIAPFTDPALEYADGAPSYSPDGRRIYFHSLRPGKNRLEPRNNTDLFFVEQTGSGWGQPQPLETVINTEHSERAPSIANTGNLYFVAEGYENGIGASDIYVSQSVNDHFTRPQNIGPSVNTEFHELTPAVAPNESYIVFASNRPIMDRQDLRLYVSFKEEDGSWGDAYRLRGWFGTAPMWRISITNDGQYLFYQEGDQYKWFSTEVIEDIKRAVLRHDAPTSIAHGVPTFVKSQQIFEPVHTNQVALGDLDGDNDLDAVCSNMRFNDSKVWLNDGKGNFTATQQGLTQQGHGVALGDLDGDGDLDIFLVCASFGETGVENQRSSKVYLNNGKAEFQDTGQNLGDSTLSGNGVSLHDFDNDGDLDALVYYYQQPHVIYLNDGSASFKRCASDFPILAFAGDMDDDGDVDIFLREIGVGYKTLVNDGSGNFEDHWQSPDTTAILGMCSLGDLDNDGDLDVIVASGNDREGVFPTTVWFNDGSGRFERSARELNITKSGRISLEDLNDDGYLDAFVTNFDYPSAIWINDGRGNLIDTGLRLGGLQGNSGAALGDLDGDGDVDAFISEFFGGSNTIWFNGSK